MNHIEEKIIIKIQKYDFRTIMRLISYPFHTNVYLCIIYILYINNNIKCNDMIFLLISQIFIYFIKNIIKRERPYINNINIHNYETAYIDRYSLPSGHAFNAFLLFYILKINNKYINFYPYLVLLSRVYLGVHYPSDVIIGSICAKIFYEYL